MPLDKVSAVTLTPPDGKAVRLVLEAPEKKVDSAASKDVDDKKTATKPAEPKFEFSSIPEGKKLKDRVDATQMIKTLETLDLKDVRKAGGVEAPKDAEIFQALVETKDEMQLDMTVLKSGKSDRWLTIKVRSDGKDAEAAKTIKAKVEGWEFKIPDWRSEQIFKTSADMFEDQPKEKPVEDKKADSK